MMMPNMAGYRKAASALRVRWNASAARSAHLLRFFDDLHSSISHEVELANSALRLEGLPEIELSLANPITLMLAGTKCRILLDADENMAVAEVVSKGILQSQRSPYARRTGEKQIQFAVTERSDPPTATRVDASQGSQEELSPASIAAAIVEDLITEIP